MRIVNIGILAHVDAGKTTLTDQLLYHAGVIAAPGSVDRGTTQTDTLDLERERGITIQSAVVSFTIADLKVNLIDTPGHPDFIAEVERALRVLDAVVLVVSAVEGVQPQTRRLFRVIQHRRLPCLIFLNKIDRVGARIDEVIADLERELGAHPLVLSTVRDAGLRSVASTLTDFADPAVRDAAIDLLGRNDQGLLDRWVEQGGDLDRDQVWKSVTGQVQAGLLQPVVCGAAANGVGVGDLVDVLAATAPPPTGQLDDLPLAVEIFKVQRAANGERSVIGRVWQGCLAVRQSVDIVHPHSDLETVSTRVTNVLAYADGRQHQAAEVRAGDIVRLQGLPDARIGDWLDTPLQDRIPAFEPPVFEYQVMPAQPEKQFDLRQALSIIADEDPLIEVRLDDVDQAIFIHLYGEVQREVVEHTLLERFGLTTSYGAPAVICVERLRGRGAAAEIFGETNPPFYATVGFRIQPKQGDLPRWRYTPGKAKRNFFDAAEIGGRSTLAAGLHGWPIVDVDVEVTDLIYLVSSVPADYRKLAALVMADAVHQAGTVVCEPVHHFTMRTPADYSGGCIHLLLTQRAEIATSGMDGELTVIEGTIPAASIDTVARSLPGLSQGRGDLDTRFFDYQPVTGEPPERRRTGLNPYNRIEFLSRLKGRF